MFKNKGFTLIELMVVITIIGILAGLSLTGLMSSKKSARDGRRKADLEQIRAALEMYRADVKTYPGSISCGGTLSSGGITYMSPIPCDPGSSTYLYSGGGVAYTLQVTMEADTSGGTCGTGLNYCVKQP